MNVHIVKPKSTQQFTLYWNAKRKLSSGGK